MRIKKIDKTNHENNRSSWKSPFSNLWLLLCFNFSWPLQISNPCLRVSFTREKLAWGQCYVAEQWVLKWTVINAIQLFQSLFNLILHRLSRVGLDSWWFGLCFILFFSLSVPVMILDSLNYLINLHFLIYFIIFLIILTKKYYFYFIPLPLLLLSRITIDPYQLFSSTNKFIITATIIYLLHHQQYIMSLNIRFCWILWTHCELCGYWWYCFIILCDNIKFCLISIWNLIRSWYLI